MSTDVFDVEPDSQHRCDNCGWVGRGDELDPICDLVQRLTPGGVVPSGQCPKCQALAYPYEEEPEVAEQRDGDGKHTAGQGNRADQGVVH